MELCKDWPKVAERYEAFWHGEIIDRPLVKVTAPKALDLPPIPETPEPADPEQFVHWLLDPDRLVPHLERRVAGTYYAGDAFPSVCPVPTYLVAIQAAYLGGKYAVQSGTAWCDPVIEDWDARNPLVVDPDNTWWAASRRMLEGAAQALGGKVALGIPDLCGGGQIVDLLRGTDRLLFDLVENPEPVREAMPEIDATWLEYWQECSDILLQAQDGYMDWLGVWSSRPAVTLECDLSIMISPEMFNEFFMPSVEKQTRWVERTIYHLDGEGAIRHLDALLELDTLDGIQWVPGAGAKPMAEWMDLLKRIQDAGKLLVVGCKADEVDALLAALRPEGVFLRTQCKTPAEADGLVESIGRRFRA